MFIWDLLTSVSMIFFSCIHFPPKFMMSLFLSSNPLCKWTLLINIDSSVVGHLGYFQCLTITNTAAITIVDQVSLLDGRVSFGYIPRSGITGSWQRTIPSFLRNHQINVQSRCTSLHSNQQWRRVPFPPQSYQHMLSLTFWSCTFWSV